MSKQTWPAFLVVLFGVSPATAQVKLEWQFKEGETFFAERISTLKQTVEIKGKVFKDQRAKTWLTAVTVKEKTKAGHVLELKIDSAAFQSEGERPSVNPQVIPVLEDKWAAKIKGCIFKITVTVQGKVAKFEGYDAFIQKLADKKAEEEKVWRSMLTEEGLREDLEEIFNILPEKAVRKGDKWKRETLELVPPFGSFKSAFDYVLEDDKGPEMPIGLTIKMTYKLPSNDGELFRVVKGNLTAEEAKGNVLFDNKAGRLVSSQKTTLVRGELFIETMGKQTKMDFFSDNNLRVRVFSK